ncbi:hypothetical protein [Streptomyces sp. NPDC057545]|uniref:hypothetical protein n=1 Tax=Streptomyces sp. NPDC057545 TaxID=3346164 RepID=UPI0036764747
MLITSSSEWGRFLRASSSTFLVRDPLLVLPLGVRSGLGGDGWTEGDRLGAGHRGQRVPEGRFAGPRGQVETGYTCRELGTQRSVPADPQRGAPAECFVSELVYSGALVRAVDLRGDR